MSKRDSSDETIRRQVSTAVAIEKRGTADTMVGQKSGPALAGPAAPATTTCIVYVEQRILK